MDEFLHGSIDDVAPYLSLEGYVWYVVLGVCYFIVQHIVLHFLIRLFYPKYMEMNQHDFHEYRMQWNALLHSVFASFFAFYCIWETCPGDKTFMNDAKCREVARNSHVWTCFFTASYLTFDTVIILAYTGIKTPIDKQTLLHHVIAAVNYYIAFWQLGFPVVIGAAFILLEMSTPFVCLRWIFFHHGFKGSFIQNVNTFLLFIFFIFGRVAFQAYIIWAFAIDWLNQALFHNEDYSTLYKSILFEMAIAVTINVVLNFWWSFLIIKQVYRIIFKGPDADKDFAGDEKDDLDSTDQKKEKKLEMAKILDSQQPNSDNV